ncbi:hypothetical protein P879_01123 [Paragonimus westermani]|uniref:C2H2-type domain-containing protein n=1 Tax=Paragonimus westermani TaxID=34504 RepID=A0A8T0DF30_9TREM|nr:hypothetical protein P879_01123 [Paragonimus westermani]
MTTVLEDGRHEEAANEQLKLSTSPKSCLKREKDECDSFSNRKDRHNSYETVKVNENGSWTSNPSTECAKRKCLVESDVHGVLDLTVHTMDGARKTGTFTQRNLSGNTYFTESDQEGMYVKSPLSTPSPESSASSTSICTALPSANGCEQLEVTSTLCFQPPVFPTLSNRIPNLCTPVPIGFDNQQFPAGFNATDFSTVVQHHLRMNSSNAVLPLCLFGANALNGVHPMIPGVSSPLLNIPSLPTLPSLPQQSTSIPQQCASTTPLPPNFPQQTPLSLNFGSHLGGVQFPWPHLLTGSECPAGGMGPHFLSYVNDTIGSLCNPSSETGTQSSSTTACSGLLTNGNHIVSNDVKPENIVYDLFQRGLRSQAAQLNHYQHHHHQQQLQQQQQQQRQKQPSQGSSNSEHHSSQSRTSSPMNSFGVHTNQGSVRGSQYSDFPPPGNFDDSPDGPCTVRQTSNPIHKYSSHEECGSPRCQSSSLREHYHCKSCNKIIIRREEMIRHAKWHRKREESLQYGFMRYSPGDDCTISECVHNGRQTHYHCLKPNCTKVYISTSDVQMHANFHRKDAVIIQEGFQRYRASESCGIQSCPFTLERTTHFHCRRVNCHFTFKNKADMEKHKLHHQKNDHFAKEGFRKYIKCETCGFPSCKYSGIINHIHCIRPGCDYVVHSSSQILSHKRKHDRRFSHLISRPSEVDLSDLGGLDCESAHDLSARYEGQLSVKMSPEDLSFSGYGQAVNSKSPVNKQSKMESEAMFARPSSGDDGSSGGCSLPDDQSLLMVANSETSLMKTVGSSAEGDLFRDLSRLVTRCIQRRKRLTLQEEDSDNQNKSLNFGNESEIPNLKYLFSASNSLNTSGEDAQITKLLNFIEGHFKIYSPGVSCFEDGCNWGESVAHSHCFWPGCPSGGGFASVDPSERNYCIQWTEHVWKAALLCCGLVHCKRLDCHARGSLHLHCFSWPTCDFTAPVTESKIETLCDHLVHHDSRLSGQSAENFESPNPSAENKTEVETDTLFLKDTVHTYYSQVPRRRGRPPKYSKYIRVPRLNVPDELCKDNPHIRELTRSMFFGELDCSDEAKNSNASRIVCGVKLFTVGESCPDNLCDYGQRGLEHYHCVRPRCFMASESLDLMNVHRREFHSHITIAYGFEHFDRSVDCRRPTCHNKKMAQHYHCTYANCDYAFIRPTTMLQHARKHEELLMARRQPNLYGTGQNSALSTLNHSSSISPVLSAPELKPSPICLPLGMSPMVAAQLPSILSGPQCNVTDKTEDESGQSNSTNHESLPGFLPIWAAAMAAAAAVAKASVCSPTMLPNPTIPQNLSPIRTISSFSVPSNTRIGLDSHLLEAEKTPVGV